MAYSGEAGREPTRYMPEKLAEQYGKKANCTTVVMTKEGIMIELRRRQQALIDIPDDSRFRPAKIILRAGMDELSAALDRIEKQLADEAAEVDQAKQQQELRTAQKAGAIKKRPDPKGVTKKAVEVVEAAKGVLVPAGKSGR